MTSTDDRLHPWLAAADTAYSQAVVGALLAAGWTWRHRALIESFSRGSGTTT